MTTAATLLARERDHEGSREQPPVCGWTVAPVPPMLLPSLLRCA